MSKQFTLTAVKALADGVLALTYADGEQLQVDVVGVGTGQCGTEWILADGGVDAIQFVGNHGTAVPDAIDEDAAIDQPLAHHLGGWIDAIGQVTGLFVIGAKIQCLVTQRVEQALDLLFQGKTGMV